MHGRGIDGWGSIRRQGRLDKINRQRLSEVQGSRNDSIDRSIFLIGRARYHRVRGEILSSLSRG